MSLEDLQRKIKTTGDMRNIVSTMKTLSSASILQYEQANRFVEKYKHNLRDAFQALALQQGFPKVASAKNVKEKHLYILIGSDNGMVGKFNREIMTTAHQQIHQQGSVPRQNLFLPVGKRLVMLAEQKKWPIYARYGISNSVKVVNTLAENIILRVDEAIQKEKVNRVSVIFHHRQQAASVRVETRQIVPFETQKLQKLRQKKWETNNSPLITLQPQQLFSALVRESLMLSIAGALNYSLAAEHWTRMTNMQNAEKNIDENLAELDKMYQQQRQEQITDELIDVISGAASLQKKR